MAFEHPVRIYWEDTDAGGIVFYANHLKFFERARTARLDDELLVTARLEETGRASLIIAQQARLKRGGALLCEGAIRIGWVDAERLRPARIPAIILEALEQ